ncbi:hypothetical protein BDFG_09258, partial [Blastomyces dermatitidis ATCC 26199]
SSCVDRSVSANDSELNVESLIKNLENIIMKELFMSCVTESSVSFPSLSVSFSVTLSQSSTPVSVSDSSASATSVLTTLTSVTPGFAASAFIISSPRFKKMLYRLNESYLSRITSLFNSIEIVKDICVFRNENMNVILFYTHRCEAHMS